MYTKGSSWEAVEDKIIHWYDEQYSHLPATKVTEIIKKDRPIGIKSIRYEGTSLYQHVRYLRVEAKRTA